MVDRLDQNQVYVSMMVDSLKKKENILLELLQLTRKQETFLRSEELQEDEFSGIIEAKGSLIEELNEIDEGFDALFKKVKQEIMSHRDEYHTQIQEMQSLIGNISDYGVQIQALEQQNSERFRMYLATKRKEIRDYHVNSRTASSYHQNMANVHNSNQSYFFDRQK